MHDTYSGKKKKIRMENMVKKNKLKVTFIYSNTYAYIYLNGVVTFGFKRSVKVLLTALFT